MKCFTHQDAKVLRDAFASYSDHWKYKVSRVGSMAYIVIYSKDGEYIGILDK